MSDLVKRLREDFRGCPFPSVYTTCNEAADEIERLRADNERLAGDNKIMQDKAASQEHEFIKDRKDALKYAGLLQAESAKLRKHAEAMADATHVYDWETHAAAYRADFPKEPSDDK